MNKPMPHRNTDDLLFRGVGIALGAAGVILISTRSVTNPEDVSSTCFAVAALVFAVAFLFTGRRCAANATGQALITLASLSLVAGCFLQAFVPSMS